MQYNTIRQYQEGGLRSRARSLLSRLDIGREVKKEQERAAKEAKKMNLEKGLGSLATFGLKKLLPTALTALVPGVGTIGALGLKALGTGASRYLGETIGDLLVKDPKLESKSGYLKTNVYDELSRVKREDRGKRLGRALGAGASTALIDLASSGFKSLIDARKSREVADPALKQTMGFDIEAPELGMQRSLGEQDFLTSGPLTGSDVSLSDAIPSDLSTDSSRAILSDASSISSQAPEAQFDLRSADLDMSPEFVQAPSLIGEEYALARDSLNTQREMEELSRNLGVSIARQEGKLGQVLGNQDIRRQGLMDLGIDNVSSVSPYFNLPMAPNRAPIANTPSDASFIASYLSRLQRPKFKGGGLFNPMKTGRRVF